MATQQLLSISSLLHYLALHFEALKLASIIFRSCFEELSKTQLCPCHCKSLKVNFHFLKKNIRFVWEACLWQKLLSSIQIYLQDFLSYASFDIVRWFWCLDPTNSWWNWELFSLMASFECFLLILRDIQASEEQFLWICFSFSLTDHNQFVGYSTILNYIFLIANQGFLALILQGFSCLYYRIQIGIIFIITMIFKVSILLKSNLSIRELIFASWYSRIQKSLGIFIGILSKMAHNLSKVIEGAISLDKAFILIFLACPGLIFKSKIGQRNILHF